MSITKKENDKKQRTNSFNFFLRKPGSASGKTSRTKYSIYKQKWNQDGSTSNETILVFGILAYKLGQHSIVDSNKANLEQNSRPTDVELALEPSDFSKKVLALEAKVLSSDLSGFKVKCTGWDLEITSPNLVTHQLKGEIDSFGAQGFFFVVEKRENPLGGYCLFSFMKAGVLALSPLMGKKYQLNTFRFFCHQEIKSLL